MEKWNTRAAPPATTAGEESRSAFGEGCRAGWSMCANRVDCEPAEIMQAWDASVSKARAQAVENDAARPATPVDEIVREIDALAEKALPLPYHGAINGGEDIDEELTTIESGHVEVAADVPNDTAEFLIRLANAWPQLRAALSARTQSTPKGTTQC